MNFKFVNVLNEGLEKKINESCVVDEHIRKNYTNSGYKYVPPTNIPWERTFTDEQNAAMEAINNDDDAFYDAVWILYERQTEEEQENSRTIDVNYKGFSNNNWGILSKIAQHISESTTFMLTDEEKRMGRIAVCKQIDQIIRVIEKEKQELAPEFGLQDYIY